MACPHFSMGHGASPSKTQTYQVCHKVVYTLNHNVIRDEARATAASSALSKILQGAVKLPSKDNGKDSPGTENNLQAAGGNVEVHCNQDILGAQLVGDVKFEKKVWQEKEGGTSRTGMPVGEGRVGQGSRGSKGADEVELMTKARESLFSSSEEGGGADNGAVAVKREGEVGRDGLPLHGIQGMEDFGKCSPRWSRREDFGIREVEDFARGRGFLNLGI